MSTSAWSGDGTCDHRFDECDEVLEVDEPGYKKWVCSKCGGGRSEDHRDLKWEKDNEGS